MTSESTLLASVVVITRNRPELLDECLRHLASQDVAGEFEVIVVDASDDERSQRVVAGHPTVQYADLRGAVGQMPRSRHVVLTRWRGAIVAFVDDDSFVRPGWLTAIAGHYTDPSVGGVGGLVVAPGEIPHPHGTVGKLSRLGTPVGDFNVRTPEPIRVDHLRGCNMSFRRDALVAIGGFDARYDESNFREETDACVRVRHLGLELVYDARAEVVHLTAPKELIGRNDRVDARYRFSVAKNTAYFRLRHFLSPWTCGSIFVVGPIRLLWESLSRAEGGPPLPIVLADWGGRLAGLLGWLGMKVTATSGRRA